MIIENLPNCGPDANHRVKLKENKKKDKYQDLARELEKLWNIKVTIIAMVTGALGSFTKGLMQGLEVLEKKKEQRRSFKLEHYRDRTETCGGSWRFEETCCHLNSSEKYRLTERNIKDNNNNENLNQKHLEIVRKEEK